MDMQQVLKFNVAIGVPVSIYAPQPLTSRQYRAAIHMLKVIEELAREDEEINQEEAMPL
jgi:hypothetical protein